MTSFNCHFRKKDKKCFFNLKKFNVSLFILLMIIAINYIIVVNSITVKGFELRDLRVKLNYLSEENRGLETNLMSMKAYSNIYSQIKDLDMVAVENINYIKLLDLSVAKR